MPTIPTLKALLEAGAHFGHRTEHWHPKMGPYIFGVRNGIHVIDVEQTASALERANEKVANIVSNGGHVLFVATKPTLQPIVKKAAESCNMPFVTERWLGGTFTNFGEIKKLIHTYLDLKDKREKGDLKKYTKLEQLQFDRKIAELDEKIGGISILKKLPEAIIVFDVRSDKTVAVEAAKCGVSTIAICDTNVNPDLADLVIPGNDDSIAATELFATFMADAVNGAEKAAAKKKAAASEKSEEDVAVSAADKASVEDLDDEVKERLAREKEEVKASK